MRIFNKIQTVSDRLKDKYWHLAKITGKIEFFKKKSKKTTNLEEKLILSLKRELHQHKKHIIFMELLIQRYENDINKK